MLTKNTKKGFSLVELIVVIAIMAVMAAVLAPALLGYVEKSRMQKDSSAMGEITNSVQLAIADQNIYDELLVYAVKGNYSCYTDGDASTNTDANKILTREPDLWLYNDNCRLLDETAYKPAGSMRGVTITFKPNGSSEYILKDGIVNQIGNSSTKKGDDGGQVLSDAKFETLYNRVRSTVGDTLKVSSQTYRNSDYTIFISMGTTGGNQADKQDAIQVYGQYNGTNLPEVASVDGISGGSQDKGYAGTNITPEHTANLTVSIGDVNSDGSVDIRDTTAIKKFPTNLFTVSSTYVSNYTTRFSNQGLDVNSLTSSEFELIVTNAAKTAADINRDGVVNLTDVELLRKYGLGIEVENVGTEVPIVSGITTANSYND